MKNGRMGYFNRAYLCVLVAAAVAFPGILHAAYTANPRQPTTYWIGSDGQWRSSATIEARSPTYPTKYLKTTVPLSAGSVGRIVKGAMGGPLGLAITGAIIAAGYLMDGDGNPVKEGTQDDPQDQTNDNWHNSNVGNYSTYPAAREALKERQCNIYGVYGTEKCQVERITLNLDSNGHVQSVTDKYKAQKSDGTWVTWNLTINETTGNRAEPGKELIPLTEDEIGQTIQNDPDLTQKVANDSIDRGTWRGRWSEMDTATDSIEGALDRVADGTGTTADTDLEQGAGVSPPTSSSSDNVSVQVEFPIFCSWATIVCDFLDWYRSPSDEPPHPDLPVTEVTLSTWESGLGGGSCPGAHTTSFQGQMITYPFDDACWAASNVFQPILLTISLIGAGLIIVGRS